MDWTHPWRRIVHGTGCLGNSARKTALGRSGPPCGLSAIHVERPWRLVFFGYGDLLDLLDLPDLLDLLDLLDLTFDSLV